MAIIHVAEKMIVAKAVGGCKFANAQGILVDGDLTSLATAKANVNTAAAKAHVATRGFNKRGTSSLDQIGNYDSTYLAGGSALKASMIALSNAQGITCAF